MRVQAGQSARAVGDDDLGGSGVQQLPAAGDRVAVAGHRTQFDGVRFDQVRTCGQRGAQGGGVRIDDRRDAACVRTLDEDPVGVRRYPCGQRAGEHDDVCLRDEAVEVAQQCGPIDLAGCLAGFTQHRRAPAFGFHDRDGAPDLGGDVAGEEGLRNPGAGQFPP